MSIASLNDDLLYTIFSHTLPSMIISHVPAFPETVESISPLNLSLVCRSWRQVVLASPLLWNSLYLQIDDAQGKKSVSEVSSRLLEYWLRLSSSSPLSIRYTGYVGKNRATRKILSLIIGERHRWKDITIRVGLEDYDSLDDDTGEIPVKPFVLDCGPPLSSAMLYFINFGDSFATVDLSESFVDKDSSLEALRLGYGTQLKLPQETGTVKLLHLRELTHILENTRALKDMRKLLTACPNLSTLSLRHQGEIVPDEPIGGQILLPHLESITFQSLLASSDLFSSVFDSLCCPSLLSLQVRVVYQSENVISLKSYEDFLLRAHSQGGIYPVKLPLIEFKLEEDSWSSPSDPQRVNAQDFASLFRHLISLERLHFSLHDATPLFRILSVPSSHEGTQTATTHEKLCPRLSEIHLHSTRNFDGVEGNAIMEEAVEMVVSRWRSSRSHLQKVSIEVPIHDWSLRFCQDKRVMECVQEGLLLSSS